MLDSSNTTLTNWPNRYATRPWQVKSGRVVISRIGMMITESLGRVRLDWDGGPTHRLTP